MEFGVGILAGDVAEEGDHLSLMVGQPVRVQDAKTTLTLPAGHTEDGRVLSARRTVDLAPAAREISLEATYQFALDDDSASLAAGTFARFNPDRDGEAELDLGIGLRYSLRFQVQEKCPSTLDAAPWTFERRRFRLYQEVTPSFHRQCQENPPAYR